MILTLQGAVVLAIMGLVIILFLSEWIRVDAVAVLVLALLGLTQVVDFQTLFSGFSSSAVIALLSIMILSAGLERSGLMQRLAGVAVRFGDKTEWRMVTVIGLIAGFMAGVIQNFGAVVLFLPTINRISLHTGLAQSRLLIPMSFCAILGSMTTLIGSSPLIILNDLLATADLPGYSPLHFFTPLPIGLTLLAMGILFFIFIGRHLLPQDTTHLRRLSDLMGYFQATYGVGGELFELTVTADSSIVDKTLRALEDKLPQGLSVVAVYYHGQSHMPPLRRTKLPEETVIAILGPKSVVKKFAEEHKLRFHKVIKVFSELLNLAQTGLCEAVIPPNSTLIGKGFRSLHMRRNHQVQVMAVLRGDQIYRGDELRDMNIRPGDTLCIFTRWERLVNLGQNRDFVVLTENYPKEQIRKNKLPIALGCVGLVLALASLSNIPVALALFVGAVSMVYTGVLSIDDAYAAISWKTIFLIAGLIPMGLAAQQSGAAAWLADKVLDNLGTQPIWVYQVSLAILATLFTVVISNVGATVLLVPIAIHVALSVKADPYLFALTVAGIIFA